MGEILVQVAALMDNTKIMIAQLILIALLVIVIVDCAQIDTQAHVKHVK